MLGRLPCQFENWSIFVFALYLFMDKVSIKNKISCQIVIQFFRWCGKFESVITSFSAVLLLLVTQVVYISQSDDI